MIDAFKLSELDKSKPLKVGETSRATTCVLCDGPIGGHGGVDWTVTIKGYGKAHTHCAADRGWSIA